MSDAALVADALGGPSPQLTSLARGAGCGCKLPPGQLLGLLGRLNGARLDERVLVGSATGDDAAVYRLGDELALVQTVDFFTPPVDDPYDFGRIAAANALSDVYAMGGTPITALNIVAFPLARLGAELLAKIHEGAQEIVQQAGASIVGGHSIDDEEPKFGLAVTGIVDPRRMVTNAGAAPGDVIVLTKPLGVGAAVAARARGHRDPELLRAAVETMTALNADSSREALAAGAHAMTDVTGFGLLGHLHHVCRESGLAARVDAAAIPHLAGVDALLEDGSGVSAGGRRHGAWAASFTSFAPRVREWRRRLLCDPCTSGGLLVALAHERAHRLEGWIVGRLDTGVPGTIDVV